MMLISMPFCELCEKCHKTSTKIVPQNKKNALKSAYLSAFQGICLSFPLHGSGRFGSDVVDNAVDVLDLVCNAV